MTRYIIGAALVLLGVWILRNVRVGPKLSKTPREVIKECSAANPTPKYRRRFDGDAARHDIRRRAPMRRVS